MPMLLIKLKLGRRVGRLLWREKYKYGVAEGKPYQSRSLAWRGPKLEVSWRHLETGSGAWKGRSDQDRFTR